MSTVPRKKRPRVVLSATMTLDARITLGRHRLLLDPTVGARWADLHPPSTATLTEHPSDSTAVLEGSGSFVVPDAVSPHGPPLTDGGGADDYLPPEVVDDPAHRRWFVVVDGRGRVPWTFSGADGTDLLVLVSRVTPTGYLAELRRKRICHLVVGEQRVDLAAALARLAELFDITEVVAEAGGTLNAALLCADLVDEVRVRVLPALIGGADTPSIVDGRALESDELPTRLMLLSTTAHSDGLVELRYEVVRP